LIYINQIRLEISHGK